MNHWHNFSEPSLLRYKAVGSLCSHTMGPDATCNPRASVSVNFKADLKVWSTVGVHGLQRWNPLKRHKVSTDCESGLKFVNSCRCEAHFFADEPNLITDLLLGSEPHPVRGWKDHACTILGSSYIVKNLLVRTSLPITWLNLAATSLFQSDSLCRHYASASGQPQNVSHFPPSQTFSNTPHVFHHTKRHASELFLQKDARTRKIKILWLWGRLNAFELTEIRSCSFNVLMTQYPTEELQHVDVDRFVSETQSVSHNFIQLKPIWQIEQKGFTKALSIAAFCTDLWLKQTWKLLRVWACLGRYVSPHPPSHTSHLFILFSGAKNEEMLCLPWDAMSGAKVIEMFILTICFRVTLGSGTRGRLLPWLATKKPRKPNLPGAWSDAQVTSKVHTLAQNCHCEFCCRMHLTCKNTPVTPDRNGSVKRPEKNIRRLPSP